MTAIQKGFITLEAAYREDNRLIEDVWRKMDLKARSKIPEGPDLLGRDKIVTVEAVSSERIAIYVIFDFTNDKPEEFILARLIQREARKMRGESVGPIF
jgi:hypothetical protein